jgi:hypothetical protein
MIRKRWFLPLVCLSAIAILNCVPHRRSHAFEQESFPDAFSVSFGWPISAVAPASDAGIDLIDSSVVLSGSSVFRNVIPGAYPHLAVNFQLVAANAITAATIAGIALIIGKRFLCSSPNNTLHRSGGQRSM